MLLQPSPDDLPPFPVDAIVLEEDTGLVLSADPEIRDDGVHPIRIMTDLFEYEAPQPGEIIVQGRTPYRFLAVVHDFDADPSCRAAWVIDALRRALGKCDEFRIRALGLQMLGARFGPFSPSWFMDVLRAALAAHRPSRLERIWMMERRAD